MPVGCGVDDVLELVGQLEDVTRSEHDRWLRFQVARQTFGYLWPATVTVGLKQTLAEQLGLVAERPEVFEVQFTAGAFGWVVVHLEGVERDELAELVFEAWRLTAPAPLVEARADRLPV
nr:MmcQ/YjbR family DNA-binding protein [Nocardioides flavescens]